MTDQEHPDPGQWWFHRRWQAYASLFLIAVIVACLLTLTIPESNIPAIQTALWILAGIVVIYSGGASAVDAIGKLRK